MAAATKKAVSIPDRPRKERIVDFSPERLRAPFFLRCAALAIDYMVLIAFPVAWLLLSRLLSETGTTASIGGISWVTGIVLTFFNLLVLPLWRGQSLGKMIAGVTVLNQDGSRLDYSRLLRRNLLGYLATVLTFGLGFLLAAVTRNGRALHDLIGGTVVVRAKKTRLL